MCDTHVRLPTCLKVLLMSSNFEYLVQLIIIIFWGICPKIVKVMEMDGKYNEKKGEYRQKKKQKSVQKSWATCQDQSFPKEFILYINESFI